MVWTDEDIVDVRNTLNEIWKQLDRIHHLLSRKEMNK